MTRGVIKGSFLALLFVGLFATNAAATGTLSIETISSGAIGGLEQKSLHFQVIASADEWKRIHKKLSGSRHPSPARPSVDFNKYLLIYAGLGQKGSGGYSIGFAPEASLENGNLTVSIVIHEPKRGGLSIAVVTSPYVVGKVLKADLRQIRFQLPDGTIAKELSIQ